MTLRASVSAATLAFALSLAAGAAESGTATTAEDAAAPAPAGPPATAVPPPPPPDAITPTPPPPPVEPDPMYFAIVNGAQIGPLTIAQLAQQIQSGAITAQTYVWADGMAEWRQIADVEELASVRPVAPPDFDQCQTWILGGWRIDGRIGNVPISTESVYRDDGTFVAVTVVHPGSAYQSATSTEGEWSIRGTGNDRCALEVHESNAFGSRPQTFVLRRIDQNRWHNETSNSDVYRTQ